MHFRNTQEMIQFYRSKHEDLRETEKQKQEQEPEEKRGKKAKDGEVLQAD